MYFEDLPQLWVPYFGNQARFRGFVVETLKQLNLPENFTFYETNSGSHAVSLEVRNNFKAMTVSNDLSSFSEVLGRALNGEKEWKRGAFSNSNFLEKRFGKENNREFFKKIDSVFSDIEASCLEVAAAGILLLENGGYDFIFEDSLSFDQSRFIKWQTFLESKAKGNAYIVKSDLFDFLNDNKGDVVYMDFAWPWKDGREVTEYATLVDVISSAIQQKEERIELWTRQNVLGKVLVACSIAATNFNYVILSNQSSNYPTWDVLEPALKNNANFELIGMKRLTLPAKDIDNRNMEPWFTEYQYILRRR